MTQRPANDGVEHRRGLSARGLRARPKTGGRRVGLRSAPDGHEALPGSEALDHRGRTLAGHDLDLAAGEALALALEVDHGRPRVVHEGGGRDHETLLLAAQQDLGFEAAADGQIHRAAVQFQDDRHGRGARVHLGRARDEAHGPGGQHDGFATARPLQVEARDRARHPGARSRDAGPPPATPAAGARGGRGLSPGATDWPGETATSATRPDQGARSAISAAPPAVAMVAASRSRRVPERRASKPRSSARARSSSAALVASTRRSSVRRSTRLRATPTCASREAASASRSRMLRDDDGAARGRQRRLGHILADVRPWPGHDRRLQAGREHHRAARRRGHAGGTADAVAPHPFAHRGGREGRAPLLFFQERHGPRVSHRRFARFARLKGEPAGFGPSCPPGPGPRVSPRSGHRR